MAQVKLKEEQERWEPAEVDHSVVREFKEEPESRDIQSLENTSSVLHCMKEEAEEVEIKAEPQFLHVSVKSEEGEPQSSVLHQTETEENREDTDAAGAGSQKPLEIEQYSENSSDTDDSEDWARSAERPTPQTQSELREQLHGPDHRNNVSEGTQVKHHICSFCGKGFKKVSHLKTHEGTHTEERLFMCAVCKKHFRTKSNLNVHMRTHTAEKLFRCTVCEKSYTTKRYLQLHLERTHKGERPFKCTVCSKAFGQMFNLKRHMRSHTGERPFKCSICAKDFTCAHHLKDHMRSHADEKPFTCSICAKGFTLKAHLKPHMRTHTGEKLFKCSICAHSFAQNGNLKSHMKTHMGRNLLNVQCVQRILPEWVI